MTEVLVLGDNGDSCILHCTCSSSSRCTLHIWSTLVLIISFQNTALQVNNLACLFVICKSSPALQWGLWTALASPRPSCTAGFTRYAWVPSVRQHNARPSGVSGYAAPRVTWSRSAAIKRTLISAVRSCHAIRQYNRSLLRALSIHSIIAISGRISMSRCWNGT